MSILPRLRRRITDSPKISDHFDGVRFHNPVASRRRAGDLLRWLASRESIAWQPVTDFTPPPAPEPRCQTLSITWINHATVLIQADGHNLLTDPVYCERLGPFPRFGLRRYHPPGVRFAALPPIDTVLISHAHYDHLDAPTIQRLIARDNPAFVAGLGLRPWLERIGARHVTTLDWCSTTG